MTVTVRNVYVIRLLAILTTLAITATACGNTPREAATSSPRRDKPAQQASPSPANPYQARIPTFAPAPAAQRVALTSPGQGLAPVIGQVPTDQPVAFITIDDGQIRNPAAMELLRANNTPASAFLVSRVAAQDPAYFQSLEGVPIQAHSVSHTSLRGKSYEQQRSEICGSADELAAMFGKRPTLFRPPYGEYDTVTQRAAYDCGMTAILYWRQSVTDGHVYYQTPEKKVQPGDIILMHFRQAVVEDYLAALQAIYDSGLTPALVEDYL